MFNNGYNSFYPYYSSGAKAGLLAGLKGRFNWGSILNNTQKTLNIVNQAIPLVYQVKPIVSNARTLFKVMGAVKDDTPSNNNRRNYNTQNRNTISTINNTTATNSNNTYINNNSNTPNFFL